MRHLLGCIAVFWRTLDYRSYFQPARANQEGGENETDSEETDGEGIEATPELRENWQDQFAFGADHKHSMRAFGRAFARYILFASADAVPVIHDRSHHHEPPPIQNLETESVVNALGWLPYRVRFPIAQVCHFALAVLAERVRLDKRVHGEIPIRCLRYWLVEDIRDFLGDYVALMVKGWLYQIEQVVATGHGAFSDLLQQDVEWAPLPKYDYKGFWYTAETSHASHPQKLPGPCVLQTVTHKFQWAKWVEVREQNNGLDDDPLSDGEATEDEVQREKELMDRARKAKRKPAKKRTEAEKQAVKQAEERQERRKGKQRWRSKHDADAESVYIDEDEEETVERPLVVEGMMRSDGKRAADDELPVSDPPSEDDEMMGRYSGGHDGVRGTDEDSETGVGQEDEEMRSGDEGEEEDAEGEDDEEMVSGNGEDVEMGRPNVEEYDESEEFEEEDDENDKDYVGR